MPRQIQIKSLSVPTAVLLATVVLALAACSPRQTPPPIILPDSVTVKSLAVMPYIDMYSIYGENVSFNCPLCGRSQVIDVVSDGADEFLTETLFDVLQQQGGYQLITPGRVQGVQATLLLDPGQKMADLDMILNIGRQLNADAVLVGRVYRFREREGEAYSAQTPAAVTFDLLLIYVPNGRLLWEGHFSESQRPLSENLYNFSAFIDRKGKWLTARELADSGLQQVMASFPRAR